MKKNKNLHVMDPNVQHAALRMLAQGAVRTARAHGQTIRWAVKLLFANAGDLATKSKCRELIDAAW